MHFASCYHLATVGYQVEEEAATQGYVTEDDRATRESDMSAGRPPQVSDEAPEPTQVYDMDLDPTQVANEKPDPEATQVGDENVDPESRAVGQEDERQAPDMDSNQWNDMDVAPTQTGIDGDARNVDADNNSTDTDGAGNVATQCLDPNKDADSGVDTSHKINLGLSATMEFEIETDTDDQATQVCAANHEILGNAEATMVLGGSGEFTPRDAEEGNKTCDSLDAPTQVCRDSEDQKPTQTVDETQMLDRTQVVDQTQVLDQTQQPVETPVLDQTQVLDHTQALDQVQPQDGTQVLDETQILEHKNPDQTQVLDETQVLDQTQILDRTQVLDPETPKLVVNETPFFPKENPNPRQSGISNLDATLILPDTAVLQLTATPIDPGNVAPPRLSVIPGLADVTRVFSDEESDGDEDQALGDKDKTRSLSPGEFNPTAVSTQITEDMSPSFTPEMTRVTKVNTKYIAAWG